MHYGVLVESILFLQFLTNRLLHYSTAHCGWTGSFGHLVCVEERRDVSDWSVRPLTVYHCVSLESLQCHSTATTLLQPLPRWLLLRPLHSSGWADRSNITRKYLIKHQIDALDCNLAASGLNRIAMRRQSGEYWPVRGDSRLETELCIVLPRYLHHLLWRSLVLRSGSQRKYENKVFVLQGIKTGLRCKSGN